jgi:outer membrane receptor for ferrienterochelin and colicins
MKINSIILFLCLSTALQAQLLTGIVRDENGQPIVGAHVYWMDKSAETMTDANGNFKLPRRSKERMVTWNLLVSKCL